MEAILPIVIQVLGLIPSLVSAGIEIETLVQSTVKALTAGNPDPSSADWQAVNTLIAANTAKINDTSGDVQD